MKKLLPFVLVLLFLAGCSTPEADTVPERESIVIALLDTGVSTAAIQSDALLAGWNYVLDSEDTEDRINHGTAVASVLLGCESAGVAAMAPEGCFVVPLVVTDKTESGLESVSPEILAQAIRDAVDIHGADIINVSLGIKKDNIEIKKAIEYAEKQGVLVVSAVGNEGESEDLYYPAAYETVLAVGSHDENGEVSDFSQRSGVTDLLAPGEDIWLASRSGKTYGSRGTSYATAYVAAAAAQLLMQEPALDAAQLREILCSSAQDIGEPGFEGDSGWGLLNVDAALAALRK